jgi:hypothetical protein
MIKQFDNGNGSILCAQTATIVSLTFLKKYQYDDDTFS